MAVSPLSGAGGDESPFLSPESLLDAGDSSLDAGDLCLRSPSYSPPPRSPSYSPSWDDFTLPEAVVVVSSVVPVSGRSAQAEQNKRKRDTEDATTNRKRCVLHFVTEKT